MEEVASTSSVGTVTGAADTVTVRVVEAVPRELEAMTVKSKVPRAAGSKVNSPVSSNVALNGVSAR